MLTSLLLTFLPCCGSAGEGEPPPSDAPSEQEQEAPAARRPSYSFLHQDEDWSVLSRLRPDDHDPFDPIKYLELADGGHPWLSFGGYLRTRAEVWRGWGFGGPPDAVHDDEYVLTLALVHADLHLGPSTRVYVEGKTSQATERELPGGRRTLDADWLALQQAFVDQTLRLGADADLTLRAGRQMLSFGRQRLVSPLPWANTLRTWEGLRGDLAAGEWIVTALATRYVPVDKGDFNEGDPDNLLFGVYAAHPANDGASGQELYWWGIARDDQAFNGTEGDERRQTLGARVWGRLGRQATGWELEAAWQLGEVGEGDVSAGMLAAELTQAFDGALRPRLHANLDWASGDSSPGGDVGTFNQLFPLGHAYFGYIDTVGRQNVLDLWGGASVEPGGGWTLELDGHAFWLDDSDDALYSAGGAVVRPGGASDSTWVGSELDLTARRRIGRHLGLLLGYSHFFPGSVISDSGPDEAIDFAYASLDLSF